LKAFPRMRARSITQRSTEGGTPKRKKQYEREKRSKSKIRRYVTNYVEAKRGGQLD